MVLAAGRGMRMRPLTDVTPKPLLLVHNKPLMQWPMEALLEAGFHRFVVNTAWLGEQIDDHCATWSQERPGCEVVMSREGADFGYALETAGGIARALPLLSDVFWVLAGDIFAPDFTFSRAAMDRFETSGLLAHIWLVPNPPHNPNGDFGLGPDGIAISRAEQAWTFSTIGLYRRQLFEPPWCEVLPGNPQGTAEPLAPLLRRAMEAGQVSAQIHRGTWVDVGTPQRLEELNAQG